MCLITVKKIYKNFFYSSYILLLNLYSKKIIYLFQFILRVEINNIIIIIIIKLGLTWRVDSESGWSRVWIGPSLKKIRGRIDST